MIQRRVCPRICGRWRASAAAMCSLEVQGEATLRSVLDALEARYPTLRGTIRDHVTLKRRPFIRFFACEEDLSHDSPDTPLPEAVSSGVEPLYVVGRSPADDRSSDRRHLRAVPSLLRLQAHEAARPAVRRRRRRAGDGRADARRKARRTSASPPITSSSRSATISGPATRRARASIPRCGRSSIRSKKRWWRWAS